MILKDNDNNNDRRVIQHNNIYAYASLSYKLFDQFTELSN